MVPYFAPICSHIMDIREEKTTSSGQQRGDLLSKTHLLADHGHGGLHVPGNQHIMLGSTRESVSHPAAHLLADHGHGGALVQQAQLAVGVLGVAGVAVDAAWGE